MTPLAGQPVLTAAEMRAAEDRAIAAGASVESLMERAGQQIAAAVRRLAGANDILILCGPGNNGGDGYVAARYLRDGGLKVRVAALSDPRTPAAQAARAVWPGPVEPFATARPAPILIDALSGTGLTRPLDAIPQDGRHASRIRRPGLEPGPRFLASEDAGSRVKPGMTIDNDPTALHHVGLPSPTTAEPRSQYSHDAATPIATKLRRLAQAAHLTIAVDLPSGVTTDDGRVLSDTPACDITLALGAAKPSHLLQPAAGRCGQVRILDIGVTTSSRANVIDRPNLPSPGPGSHKYTRGMVAVVAGAMPGAARLAGIAAMRAGAGYVLLFADDHQGPDALVHKRFSVEALADKRIGALLIGPGLGRGAAAEAKLDAALATDHALIIDGDALHLLKGDRLTRVAQRASPSILTPHAGEFDALFETGDVGKIDRARAGAVRANATIVFKGADTVIAAPDGAVRLAEPSSAWLSTAGTGDVLAGTIAATLAARLSPLDAAAAGVWLHADAARRLGPAFIADDLAAVIGVARASL